MMETLLDLARALFAIAFAGQRLFLAALFTGLQIKRVTLYFLYDVFLLHFPLEAAQSTLQGFPVLEMDFCQINSPPSGTAAGPHRAFLPLSYQFTWWPP